MAGISGRMRATLRVALEASRSPALRRLVLAYLAFSILEYGSWVAILVFAYAATGPTSVAVVALAQLAPAAFIAPIGATLGDRFPRHRVLVGGYLGVAVIIALTAAGMLLGWPPVLVYLAAITVAVPLTLVRPTHNALLPALSHTPDELTAANAATSMAEAGGLLLGPLAAAVILAVATPGVVLAILCGGTVAGAALVIPLRPLRTSGQAGPEGMPDGVEGSGERRGLELLAGVRALVGDADARLVVAILAARMLMIGVTDVLFVLLAIQLFGTGESGAAVLSAALGAGGLLGGAAAFVLVGRPQIAPILLGCAIAWGVALGVVGLSGSATLAPLLLIGGGTGLAVMDVAGRTILQRGVRDAVLVRVFGILEGLMMAALAAGSILVPAVVAAVGLAGSVLVFAALLPAFLALVWPGLRALDRRSAVPLRALTLLRRLRLFEALEPPALEGLARSADWVTVPAGRVIIREGDRGDRFYVLESGTVSVTRDGLHVRTLDTAGDGFGEIALLRDLPRTATVTADVETTLMTLAREPFLAAVTRHPVVVAAAGRVVEARLLADREAPPA